MEKHLRLIGAGLKHLSNSPVACYEGVHLTSFYRLEGFLSLRWRKEGWDKKSRELFPALSWSLT
jgi:hypothetical protein